MLQVLAWFFSRKLCALQVLALFLSLKAVCAAGSGLFCFAESFVCRRLKAVCSAGSGSVSLAERFWFGFSNGSCVRRRFWLGFFHGKLCVLQVLAWFVSLKAECAAGSGLVSLTGSCVCCRLWLGFSR